MTKPSKKLPADRNKPTATEKWASKKEFSIRRVAFTVVAILILCVFSSCFFITIRMPGKSYTGPLPLLEESTKTVKDRLEEDVTYLATSIGERNMFVTGSLQQTADYISKIATGLGYTLNKHPYKVDGKTTVNNLEIEIKGTSKPDEIIIIGAHYDSISGSPGANDNASGTAAVLELARMLKGKTFSKTIRLLFFVNEEPPFFQTENMGSYVYAQSCKDKKENIIGMIAIETIGYFSDKAESQNYPAPLHLFYPSTANFVAFVSNNGSSTFLKENVEIFRKHSKFPSEGCATIESLPGIGWSDHWSFWQAGYSGVMVTDTAPYRYNHYHLDSDTPEQLDYDRMATIVEGLNMVIQELATSKE